MKQKVKSIRWTESQGLEMREGDVADPGPGQVQIAVQSAGICGSDLHFYRRVFPAMPGIVPGHEFGGIVSAVGAGVDHVREGDVVGVEPLLRCGSCRFCKSGAYHMCESRGLLGERVDGGMSEFATVPGNTVFKAPGNVDGELAALAEPLACSVHGFEKVNLRSDETVLIIGAGSIGLTAVLAAKAIGAQTLIVARHPHQQEAARLLGADEAIGDDEAGRTRLNELSTQGVIDVALESVGGQADTILQAELLVRPMGRVVVLGIFSVPAANINPLYLTLNEVQIVGAVTYAAPNGRAEYDMALGLLADHGDVARTLITHRYALADVNEAYATALDKSTRSIKVHLKPTAWQAATD